MHRGRRTEKAKNDGIGGSVKNIKKRLDRAERA